MQNHKLADRILRNYEYNMIHKGNDVGSSLFEAVTDGMTSFPSEAKADLHAVLADLWPNYASGMSRKIAVRIAVREWRSRYQRFALVYQQVAEDKQEATKIMASEKSTGMPVDAGIAALIGGVE